METVVVQQRWCGMELERPKPNFNRCHRAKLTTQKTCGSEFGLARPQDPTEGQQRAHAPCRIKRSVTQALPGKRDAAQELYKAIHACSVSLLCGKPAACHGPLSLKRVTPAAATSAADHHRKPRLELIRRQGVALRCEASAAALTLSIH